MVGAIILLQQLVRGSISRSGHLDHFCGQRFKEFYLHLHNEETDNVSINLDSQDRGMHCNPSYFDFRDAHSFNLL